MFWTSLIGIIAGALFAFVEYFGYGKVILDVITHWKEVLPHVGEVF